MPGHVLYTTRDWQPAERRGPDAAYRCSMFGCPADGLTEPVHAITRRGATRWGGHAGCVRHCSPALWAQLTRSR